MKKTQQLLVAENPVKDYKLGRMNLFTITNKNGDKLQFRFKNGGLASIEQSMLLFREEDIAIIRKWDFEKPQKFTVFPEPFYAEFMTHISGIKYTEAKSLVIQAEIDGITLPIIHLNSLLQNKKATGRKKDLADVEYLERIMEIRNKRMR